MVHIREQLFDQSNRDTGFLLPTVGRMSGCSAGDTWRAIVVEVIDGLDLSELVKGLPADRAPASITGDAAGIGCLRVRDEGIFQRAIERDL